MELKKVLDYLDEIFDLKNFSEPYSTNGLQIEGKPEVKKFGFAVDCCENTINKCIKENCDMLICHHGIFWPNLSSITKHTSKRIKLLMENNISLVGIHLPLDKHEEFGNNNNLIKLFDVKNIESFSDIGFTGELNKSLNLDEIKNILDKKLDTNSRIFKFKNDKIKKIAIVSGGGGYHVQDLFGSDCDLFITGEIQYFVHNEAKENNLNIITSGHYATETLGIKSLMNKMKDDIGIDCVYIENKIDL